MTGIASLFDVGDMELVLFGLLGGLGAAASAFLFMQKLRQKRPGRTCARSPGRFAIRKQR